MAKSKKQVPGTYLRLNSNTQLMETRNNRAARRMNQARARKWDPKLRAAFKEARLHRDWKASRIYSE